MKIHYTFIKVELLRKKKINKLF